jgi:hypothetical protein
MKGFQTMARRVFSTQLSRTTLMILTGLLVFSVLALSVVSASKANRQAVSIVPTQTPAQTALNGQWLAEFDASRPAFIKMMFTRQSEEGGSYMTSDNISRDELQGFPSDANSSSRINVNFRIVREAGTFNCEGYFGAGKGAGFWTLMPSQSFVENGRLRPP